MQARHESGIIMQENGEFRIQREISDILSLDEGKLVVIDVGANNGQWTVSLLNLIPYHKVSSVEIHAFEPISETYDILKKNVESHAYGKQVNLVHKACSSISGFDEMFIASTNSGSNSLHKGIVHSDLLSESIEKITLDKYCIDNHLSKIHFIKSDTEGHEVEVIKGSKKLFAEEKVMVFQFEYNHLWCYSRYFMKDVFDFLDGMPYFIGKIAPQGLYVYRKWHPEIERFFESNYLIIHKSALGWFHHEIGSFDEFYYYEVER